MNHHLVPDLGNTALARLTTQDIQSFVKAKSDAGLSARTVKQLRDTLRKP